MFLGLCTQAAADLEGWGLISPQWRIEQIALLTQVLAHTEYILLQQARGCSVPQDINISHVAVLFTAETCHKAQCV